MSSGWVKIHRRILGWSLYGDVPCRLLFLHMLLVADRNGRVSVPQAALAAGCGLTRQEARTAIGKMVESGVLEEEPGESRRAGTGYLIRKWAYYQGAQEVTEESSNNQKANHKNNQIKPLAINEMEDYVTIKSTRKSTNVVQEEYKKDKTTSCPVLSARVREGQDDRTGQDISAGDGKPLAGPGGPAEAARAYPTAPEEVVCMARGLGYSMCLNDAAEWLRMNYAYGWRGMDGEPIRTWKRLLRGYLRRNDFRTMAQVEAEERLRAEEAARRRALLEERRRRELEARGPMVSGEAATAILMGDAKE